MTTTNPFKPNEYYCSLVKEFCKLSAETEWLEFKSNAAIANDIGEYISALANSSALIGKTKAYIIWGIDNNTHEIAGTTFNYKKEKVGGEELESWLLHLLSPKIDFSFINLAIDNKNIVLLEISAAFRHPVQFKNIEYLRVGSYKKKLKDYPEKERNLWRVFDKTPFEKGIAKNDISEEDIVSLIDYPSYFSLLNSPLPSTRDGIIESLALDALILKNANAKWDITNLGAILLANDFSLFPSIKRKAIRIIQYKGINKIDTIREQVINKGYACSFENIINFIKTVIPSNEVIGSALRKDMPMFPDIAIRELVANALIHQDLYMIGSAPLIEIFSDRIEITNPGKPLVETNRFLDSPPQSRNEALASFMRRIGICEERGSGIDKVIFETAFYQLPAPLFEEKDNHTIAVLFSHKDFPDMDKEERIRACYWHACLQYVTRQPMTNKTLRKRFGIKDLNGAQATRVINGTVDAKLIKKSGIAEARKNAKYVPYWS